MALCPSLVISCPHTCKSQPSLLLSSAYPCVGTSAAADIQFVTVRLCHRVRVAKCKSARVRSESQMVVPNLRTESEQDLHLEEGNTSELAQQIIMPNLEVQRGPESISEHEATVEADLGELDTCSESEEVEEDSWLKEFQRHLPLEINQSRDIRSQVSDYSGLPRYISRRRVLGAPMFMSLLLGLGGILPVQSAQALVPTKIDLTKVPESTQFDASDSRLLDAASIFRQALDASTVDEEETLWTKVIDQYEEIEAKWVPDILARAFGNRGNARGRQGKLELALADYNRSIELAPYAVDPVLNRGVVLESLGRLEEASADYEAVLQAQPEDPAAWNNLGNVKGALGQWDEALHNFSRATQLAPKFSFAAANYALALYQVGRDNEALRQFRNLLRRYPEFADVRAALAVTLYQLGLVGEAETNWARLEDVRYGNREWVRNTRRWPPRLAGALEDFLDVKQKHR